MERSFLKGLMKAAKLSRQEDLKVLVAVLPPPPSGPRGWMRDWARAARRAEQREVEEYWDKFLEEHL